MHLLLTSINLTITLRIVCFSKKQVSEIIVIKVQNNACHQSISAISEYRMF